MKQGLTLSGHSNPHREPLLGVIYGSSAFLIWGMAPIYWKVLKPVPAFEITMHRSIWSLAFLFILLAIQKRWTDFRATLKNKRTFMILLLTAMLVATTWLIFIWAVNNDHVLETSLGFYINPLFNVVLGLIFLKERLRIWQSLSVILATIGVLYITMQLGKFPWISLSLALTFGLYGLLRKVATVDALVGLSVETLILSVPALIYLVYLAINGTGSFLSMNVKIDIFLMGSASVTGLPLLWFTKGARRLNLSTVGFLQYIAPSCSFLLAIFLFHEPFKPAQGFTFILIWTALVIYSYDTIMISKKLQVYLQPSDID